MASPGAPPTSEESAIPAESKYSEEAPHQLLDALSTGAKHAVDAENLTAFEAARLHLFSTAALGHHVTIQLGVHEANLLYKHRAELEITEDERMLLWSTVVHQTAHTIPGWFWLRDGDYISAVHRLFQLAITATDEVIRSNAIGILREACVPLEAVDFPGVSREDMVVHLVNDSSSPVRLAKLQYLAEIGLPADLPAIERLTSNNEDEQLRNAVFQCRTLILARAEPNRVLREVAEQHQAWVEGLQQVLQKRRGALDPELLLKATQHPDPAVRLFVGRILVERGAVNSELAWTLVVDPSDDVQTLYYCVLLKSGDNIPRSELPVRDELEPLIVKRKGRETLDALRGQLKWFDVDGADAYAALGKYHFGEFGEQLRADLRDNFNGLRGQEINRLRLVRESLPQVDQRMRQNFAKELEHQFELLKPGGRLDLLMERLFTVAALDALAEHGGPKDAALARPYLANEQVEVKKAAIRVLERFGDASDCQRLLELTKKEGTLQRMAALAAIRLSGRSVSVLKTLLESDSPRVVELALREITANDLAAFRVALIRLLTRKSPSIRIQGVACLRRLLSDEELERVLVECLSNRRYYYDVICWLDRVLYAPEPLQGLFVWKLQQRVD